METVLKFQNEILSYNWKKQSHSDMHDCAYFLYTFSMFDPDLECIMALHECQSSFEQLSDGNGLSLCDKDFIKVLILGILSFCLILHIISAHQLN